MALLSFAPESIKPISLVLNIVVASIASYKFIKAGYFDKKILIPFAITAIPMAFVGGYLQLKPDVFKLTAGIFLVFSGVLLLARQFLQKEITEPKPVPLTLALILGACIGFFSGLIGVGGGIFLSPILIMMNWTTVKNASGTAALFILFNSISGLLGHSASVQKLDSTILYCITAVFIGGYIGSYLGTKKFNNKIIISCLFLVLISAGVKFIISFTF